MSDFSMTSTSYYFLWKSYCSMSCLPLNYYLRWGGGSSDCTLSFTMSTLFKTLQLIHITPPTKTIMWWGGVLMETLPACKLFTHVSVTTHYFATYSNMILWFVPNIVSNNFPPWTQISFILECPTQPSLRLLWWGVILTFHPVHHVPTGSLGCRNYFDFLLSKWHMFN